MWGCAGVCFVCLVFGMYFVVFRFLFVCVFVCLFFFRKETLAINREKNGEGPCVSEIYGNN